MTQSGLKDLLKVVSADEEWEGDRYMTDAARRHFPGEYSAPWVRACYTLEKAGYGDAIVQEFIRHSPRLAELVGPIRVFMMAQVLSSVAIKAGTAAAEFMPSASIQAAIRLQGDEARFRSWLGLMERFSSLAPESTKPVLQQVDMLLARLNVSRLESWLMAGVRSAGTDAERRFAFFSFQDPEAEHWLERESSEVVYADLAGELKLFISSLWGIRPPLREPPVHSSEYVRRRAGFSSGIVRVPTAFPGYRGERARDVYYALVAHAGAHLIHSGSRFPVGGLKPVQIALVSLIEDARVEHLAMREFPGLKRLWIPFHIALSTGVMTAPSLFARLSHALIDPDFKDISSWVSKGREMFFDRSKEWENPAISRDIGNLLGNDIGQMRVQFNPKTYVVEPPYRDDNMGLWDFDEQVPPEAMQSEPVFDSVRIEEQQEDDPSPPDKNREEHRQTDDRGPRKADLELQEEEGITVARYPEYDYAGGKERPDWTTLVEYPPLIRPAFVIDEMLETHAHVVNRIKALIASARVSRPQRVRGLNEGEFLDVDAAINAMISRRTGTVPDGRIYGRFERRHRDLSIQVLLDISESTKDKVVHSDASVLDLEVQATALLAHAMAGQGDPFAISAFCSNRRDNVRYFRIKDFNQPYGEVAKSRLVGLTGGYSTRIGAAMRHAVVDLKKQQTHRRLLLVITDGEPWDIDVADRNYLVEDARRVIHALALDGIDVFCVGLDSGGDSYLTRIFGRRNCVQIDRIEKLPEQLPMLYFRLTA